MITPNPLQLLQSAILKWKLFIELLNVSALKSVIQISDEEHQHLTHTNNQLTNQLWDTRRIHNLVQMELFSQLNENRSLLTENTQLRNDQFQHSNPHLAYKHIITSNLLPSETTPTIHIKLHDQLVDDLKGEHEETIKALELSLESLQEKYEIKFTEHQHNLQQYQTLKEDYSSLYKLILAFGQSPQTITLPSTYKSEVLSQHTLTQHFQASPISSANPSCSSSPQSTFTRPTTRRQKITHPPTPTEYKLRIKNIPQDSLRNLKCESPERTLSSHTKKPSPTSSTLPRQNQSSHTNQLHSPNHPSHTLNIGDPKQIMAISILKTSVPLDHQTILEPSPTRAATTATTHCEASEELTREYGVDLIAELSQELKKRRL